MLNKVGLWHNNGKDPFRFLCTLQSITSPAGDIHVVLDNDNLETLRDILAQEDEDGDSTDERENLHPSS